MVVGVWEEAGLLSHARVEVGDGFDKILAGTLGKISEADSRHIKVETSQGNRTRRKSSSSIRRPHSFVCSLLRLTNVNQQQLGC